MLRKNNITFNQKNNNSLSSLASISGFLSKPKLIQSINLTPQTSNNTSSQSISFAKHSTPNFSINLNLSKQKLTSKINNISPGKQNMYFSFNPLNYSTNNFNYSKDSFYKNNNKSIQKKRDQQRFIKRQKKSFSTLNSQTNNLALPNYKFSLQSTLKSQTESRGKSTQKSSMESSKQLNVIQKSTQQQNIKVYIRFKPSNSQQMPISLLNDQIVQIQEKNFVFDQCYYGSQQQQLFQYVGKPIVAKVFSGFNGTIFAYGQTGSGKTYTIFGEKNEEGLIPRAIQEIYQKKKSNIGLKKIKCSLVQIYKEQLIDLFDVECKNLKLKQTKKQGVYIQNLSEIQSQSSKQIIDLIYQASKNRRVGSTKINEKSSRSHTILTLILQYDNFCSKLSLIDLAGSQKVRKSGVTGQSLQETKKINYSLSCLGNVINALTTRSNTDHIPFRDSKLTRILKDSLSGSFMTSIIVTCSSDKQSLHQTISSLKFAQRAKKVKLLPQNYLQKQNSKNKKGQEIQHLQNVIKELSYSLEQTKKQLNKYKENNKNKQQQVIEIINQKCETEGDLSARLPIPSQRAHVSQKISKYIDKKIGLLQSKRSSTSSYRLQHQAQSKQKTLFQKKSIQLPQAQIFSLNVSNTMMLQNHDMISPNMSGFYQNQQQVASQISFSFSVLNRDDLGVGGTSRQNSKRTIK